MSLLLEQMNQKISNNLELPKIKIMKVLVNRILNLDGTWQGYKLTPSHAHAKVTWSNPGKQFDSLDEVVEFYKLQNVRELGVKYTYDNKNQKYGIEEWEANYDKQ